MPSIHENAFHSIYQNAQQKTFHSSYVTKIMHTQLLRKHVRQTVIVVVYVDYE